MNAGWVKWVVGLGLAVGGVAVASSSDVVLDALLQRPADDHGTVVVPDRFVRSWDPVTVFFDGNPGPADGGPADHADALVKLAPNHPGAWTWLDGHTLQFRPAEPWAPLATVTVRTGGKTTVLSTLASPPIASTPPNGADGLSAVDTVTLVFAEPIDVATLAKMTLIELRPLPGIGDGPATRLRSDAFEVKPLDRASEDDPAAYTLVLREPLPPGQRVVVRVTLSQDEAADDAIAEVVFRTAEPFRPVTFGCDGATLPVSPGGTVHPAERPIACTGARSVRVGFTSALGAVSPVLGRNLVRFEPAVDGLSFTASGRELVVRGAFRSEVPYRVALAPTPVVDAAGRTLDITGESVVWLYFPRRDPYLRWGVGQGVAEQHGPKRIPVEGRGIDDADVRVYRVDPLNRALWPFPSDPIAIDESARPPGPGEEPGGWDDPDPISTDELAQRLRSLGSPGWSGIVHLPDASDDAARFGLDLAPALARVSGKDAPGHYLVGLRRLDGTTERTWVRLQVTDLALTTVENPADVLFQVSSLASGGPVAGAVVTVEAREDTPGGASRWVVAYDGRTGADGTVRWTVPGEGHLSVRRIVVRKGDDALVLDPNRPPDGYVDGAWLDGGDTWLGWAFRDLAGRAEEVRTLVHLFPDRPVYRPGDEVQLKGYVRSRFQGHLTPARGTGAIVVVGPGDAEWRLPVELSGGGSIHAVWQEDEPPTGAYVALFEDERGVRFGETSFRVEAYRLPTFEVSLTGPQNVTTVANDRAFDVGLVATYYAGGRVAARPVRWRVTQFPFAWTPASTTASPSLAGFAWSSDDRYSRGGGFRATPELAIDATTAANGESSLSLDPGIEADARPRTYLVEATVTGADDLTVTSTLRVDAVPAFVLGLKAPRYLPDAKAIPVEVVAVGPDGAVVPGLDTTVRLIRREWHSVLEAGDFTTGQAKYLTDVVDVPVRDTPVETGARAVSTSLPIDRPGVYLVEVEARDALDRVQVVRIDLYAGGEGAVGWEKPKAGTFDLSLDAKSYRPGKQANIVVRSPFQQGSALAVIEAPDGNRYRQVEVRGGQATIQIPIETGWVPRIPVHVVLRRGRTADPPADGFDTGKPQTVASTVWLPIDPVENQVTVTVSNPERALPGQTVPVTVKLADPDGKPLAGELTLWLVDQAVLALGREQRLDPVPDFVDGRESRMTVHDTRNQVLGQLPVDPMPGGDGELEEESVLDKATVRKDFRPLAYYAPSLKVPASGTLTVDVALPDNLTVFKIRAKAMSGAERFGVGTGQIAVRLPVVVQPALPRFVRPGDRFEAAGLVRVIEGDGGPGRVELAAAGLTVEGDAARAVTLDPALANRVAWPVTVTTPPIGEDGTLAYRTVKLTIGAKRSSDGASDAAETVLPLRDDRRVRYDRQLVDLASKGTATIPALTEPARPGSVHRSVVVGSHQGLLRMAAAVDVSRTGEPHGTDAILSRGRIVVGLGALRGPLGLEDDAEIRGIVDETVAWLPVVLDDRGLVAQYPGAAGRVWLTADALAFLADAKAQGYPVDGRITAALEGALTAALRSDYAYFLDGESWSERTAALYGLAVDGKFDAGYFAELARNTRFLVPEAQARTLLAATRGGQGASPAAVELAGKVSNEVVTELYQGKERYAGLKSRRTDRTPFVAPSEAREVATILRALLAATPSEPKLDELVDALVRLGKTDGWGQPNADAAATIALAEAQRTLAGPATTVSVADGARTTPLTLTATATLARATTASAGALTLTDSGAGPATALVVSRWIPAADGSAQAPEQSGFVVEREWLVVSASGPADRRPIAAAGTKLAVSVGQVLEEHVRIVNPVDRTDVIVVVPLAAGVEPLNPALATAGPDATPANRSTGNPTWTSFGDDRALYAFERLPKGTYDLYFRTKAAVAGTFVQPAASAEMVYDRRAIGLSAGAKVEITGGS